MIRYRDLHTFTVFQAYVLIIEYRGCTQSVKKRWWDDLIHTGIGRNPSTIFNSIIFHDIIGAWNDRLIIERGNVQETKALLNDAPSKTHRLSFQCRGIRVNGRGMNQQIHKTTRELGQGSLSWSARTRAERNWKSHSSATCALLSSFAVNHFNLSRFSRIQSFFDSQLFVRNVCQDPVYSKSLMSQIIRCQTPDRKTKCPFHVRTRIFPWKGFKLDPVWEKTLHLHHGSLHSHTKKILISFF